MASQAAVTSSLAEPIRLPQDSASRFLRGLKISPKAKEGSLTGAVEKYNNWSHDVVTVEQMPEMLARAWGELPPFNTGDSPGAKPKCKKGNPRRLRTRVVGRC